VCFRLVSSLVKHRRIDGSIYLAWFVRRNEYWAEMGAERYLVTIPSFDKALTGLGSEIVMRVPQTEQ
jgi:hypothetical protein